MSYTLKMLNWRALGHTGLLVVAGTFLNCKCIDHPLYGAGVNRWDGFYMGGGNSQTRPCPAGFRSAALAEPAVLQPTCTPQGIALQVWVHDEVTATTIAVVHPMQSLRQRTAIGTDRGASQLVPIDDAIAMVDLDHDLIVDLEDSEGILTSVTMTADQTATALASCQAEGESSAWEGKGE